MPPLCDLSWIPDKWWYLVTGQKRRKPIPKQINRRQFEVCLFSQIVQELKSADLCVAESDKFTDFRDQLVSWEEFHEKLPRYAEFAGIPVGNEAFIDHIRRIIKDEAENLDHSYPNNKEFTIRENGELSLKKLKAKSNPDRYDIITELISNRMPLRDILDVIVDTQKLLNWCRVFGPISGLGRWQRFVRCTALRITLPNLTLLRSLSHYMMKYMEKFKHLMDTCSEAEMDYLTAKYEGFYDFALFLEHFASAIRNDEIKVP